jgi:subtilisin family serine protease
LLVLAKTPEKAWSVKSKWNGAIAEELPEIHAFLVRIDENIDSAVQQEATVGPDFSYVERNYYVGWALTPDDPSWPSQWALSKVRADAAWNIEVGKRSVFLAVIDTGIDYTHEDLAWNYVPKGYDWVNHDPDPMDDSSNGHGTHVAGIIGALTGNGQGIAGIAQVSIMAEKVLNSFGMGTVFDVANGVIHSVQQGARITINSYGTYSSHKP